MLNHQPNSTLTTVVKVDLPTPHPPFFLLPVTAHLQKCQENCHVIKQSDISSGSQAESDGSNILP